MSAETTLWSRDSWESAPDDVLLDRAREGSAEAFGELWRRHLPAAYGVAGKHGGRTPAEDIVAEAAAKVFTLLQSGRGPDEHFRAYFLTTVRTVAVDHTRRELRLLPVAADDLELLTEPTAVDGTPAGAGNVGGVGGEAIDGGDSELYDTELVRVAFTGLPERDQRVLWHTTVEGEPPRVAAPQLGMTPGAVSSRAMRARESLRAGYLDAYAARCLEHAESRECSWTIERLGRLVRGRLPRRQAERAEAHVASCPHAAAVAADLSEIHRGFPALVVPLVLAVGFGSSGLAAALGFAGVGAAGAGAGAAALAAMGEMPGAADPSAAAAGLGGGAPDQGAALAEAAVAGGGADAGTGGAAAAAAPASGSGAAAEPPAASPLAARAAVLLAAGVVALGLVAAALTSGQPDAAPPTAAATSRPATSASGDTTGASPTPEESGAATAASSTSTPPTAASTTSASAAPSGTGSAGASTGTSAASPRPTATTPRSAPSGSGSPAPAPAPAPPPVSGVAARLLGSGDPSRISLRLPAASAGGSMTVTVSTVGGVGSLSAGNRTFTCRQSTSASLTCVGDGGQIQLLQSGTGGPTPLVVRVRDASGAVTQSVVVPS